MSPFADRTFRVEDRRRVVADATIGAPVLRALIEAIRARRHALSVAGLQDAEAVFAVRGLTAIADRLDASLALGDPVPVTIDRHEALALAEAAAHYGSAYDQDGYLPAAERERLATLETVLGALMDVLADLAGAEAEAVEQHLLNEV